MKKVPASKVATRTAAADSPLPPKVQEALGEMVGAAREGVLAPLSGATRREAPAPETSRTRSTASIDQRPGIVIDRSSASVLRPNPKNDHGLDLVIHFPDDSILVLANVNAEASLPLACQWLCPQGPWAILQCFDKPDDLLVCLPVVAPEPA